MPVKISESNCGLQNLKDLVDRLEGRAPDKNIPIVLVSGFSGWGEALFGTFNYWGGFEDLPKALKCAGYTVIIVRIGPLSSNWERACEIYAQLTSEDGFDCSPDIASKTPVDFGIKYPKLYGYQQICRTKKAVLLGKLPAGWKWSQKNPVHFIAHSQGGSTVRYLMELMSGDHSDKNPCYFSIKNRQNWTKSLVTLGTPHKGTTIIDVVKTILPPDTLTILVQLITSVSFKDTRFYDLQLDHWGFARLPGEQNDRDGDDSEDAEETFMQMEERITPAVKRWWDGVDGLDPHNGFHDNSIEGMAELNKFASTASHDTYYFTMSFDATVTFPNVYPTAKDLYSFPSFLATFPLTRPFVILGSYVGAGLIRLAFRLKLLPNIVSIVRWFVKALNRQLGARGYFDKIPSPGRRAPRSDMLPIMLVTAVGMGGWDGRVAKGFSATEFQPNDGVVNTISMRGPDDRLVHEEPFPVHRLSKIDEDREDGVKGKYWHLGINHTMDHGDEIGVFTEGKTYLEIKEMYLLFGKLLSKLP